MQARHSFFVQRLSTEHFVCPTFRKPAKTNKGQKKEDLYRGDVKYTAQKLYEKGVVLEIEGLPPAQYVSYCFY